MTNQAHSQGAVWVFDPRFQKVLNLETTVLLFHDVSFFLLLYASKCIYGRFIFKKYHRVILQTPVWEGRSPPGPISARHVPVH